MSSIDKINVGGVDFDITSSPTPVMAPVETGTTATQAYAVGDYVIVGSTLHEVTAPIAINDTFTEGTNISTSTSLGDEIKEVKDDVTELNNDLTEIRGLVNMKVNYSSLEWESSANSSTHTVVNDGELFISLYSPNNSNQYTLLINNNPVFNGTAESALPYGGIDHIPVSRGDVISISTTSSNIFMKCRLYNYKTA